MLITLTFPTLWFPNHKEVLCVEINWNASISTHWNVQVVPAVLFSVSVSIITENPLLCEVPLGRSTMW